MYVFASQLVGTNRFGFMFIRFSRLRCNSSLSIGPRAVLAPLAPEGLIGTDQYDVYRTSHSFNLISSFINWCLINWKLIGVIQAAHILFKCYPFTYIVLTSHRRSLSFSIKSDFPISDFFCVSSHFVSFGTKFGKNMSMYMCLWPLCGILWKTASFRWHRMENRSISDCCHQ